MSPYYEDVDSGDEIPALSVSVDETQMFFFSAATGEGEHSAKAVSGDAIAIKPDGGSVTVNNAKVVKADVEASNGVIHVIDTVIMPGQTN